MPKVLRRLKINEISAVDRGAGHGVRVMLMKRANDLYDLAKADSDLLGDDVLAYLKREFSADQRRAMARSGQAMHDGSYPIANRGDLQNAIHAVGRGRANSHAAIRRHIITRARALGATSMLPEKWNVGKRWTDTIKNALGFTKPTVADVVSDSTAALEKAVSDIVGDEGMDRTAKREALNTVFAGYQGHLNQELPKTIVDTLADAGLSDAALNKKEAEMAEDDGDEKKRKAREDGDEEKRSEPEDERKARFGEDDGDEKRDNRDEDDGDEKKRKAVDDGGTDGEDDDGDHYDGDGHSGGRRPREKDALSGVNSADARNRRLTTKRDYDIMKRDEEIRDLRKRLETIEYERDVQSFRKRAQDMGQPPAFGDIIMKAERGDGAAAAEIVKALERTVRLAETGRTFAEFGAAGNGVPGDAMDQLTAKAAELRKRDPSLTREQAFAKVYEDPTNFDLAREERRGNRPA